MNFSDTETLGGQFGLSDVYDAAKTNWGNIGKGPPGSRGEDNARNNNTGNWKSLALRERGKGKKGRERNANVTNEERTTEENENDPGRNAIENEFSEESRDVNFTVSGADPSSDLDWGGKIENFGTDGEAEQFLQNNEVTRIYEPQPMWMFSEFLRKTKLAGVEMEKQRSFRQFNKKLTGGQKAKTNFGKCRQTPGF